MIKLDRETLFNKEYLKESLPFVISFNNIVDYIMWKPQVQTGEKVVKRGSKRWEEIEVVFSKNGWYYHEKPTEVFYLGGVYDSAISDWSYLLLSNAPVKIPHMPKYMWLYTPNKAYVLQMNNKSLYVNLLKILIKATIVKI